MEPRYEKHHFIPRFILKQFAPKDQPPTGPLIASSDDSRRRKKSIGKRRDFLVNKVDLERSILTQRPVSTEFALIDMYRDPGFDQNPYHLEKKLAKLENQASDIISRAFKQFSRGLVLELKRSELDNLRKFLFLMKYRNSGMFDRYDHDDIDGYQADDRMRMLDYMRARNFEKPREVWFDNLRQFLDLEMDPAKSWTKTLKTRVYPDDAKMMELHITGSFIAFCEPLSSGDEFLLTQNAFCIFEGPSTGTFNPLTQKMECNVYNEYHNFAPLSPRLMIILRSHLLDSGGEEPPILRNWRDQVTSAVRSQHLYPDKAGSILQHLPIRICQTVYVQSRVNSSTCFDVNDRFCFPCFKISSGHLKTINNLLLEEANMTTSIVYHSHNSLKTSIESYLREDTPGIKNFLGGLFSERRLYLTTLEKIVRDLGGSTTCRIHYLSPRIISPNMHMSLFAAAKLAIALLQSEEKEAPIPQVYSLLKPEASRKTFWNDIHQASLMVLLRCRIDMFLKNSRLTDKEKCYVRLSRQIFFMTFPVERLWLYFKIARNLDKFDDDDFTIQIADLELSGVEDKFTKFLAYFPDKREYLVPMMYFQAMQ
ncbi:uncharacterized protein N7496_008033 [Penicillium cataractarum]|uniref:DUF4238 domain-containing protein n=1 Tax=Penicillium cataractarum TaxID=2100454 RepID=A0A9W9V461_9EURO|nr:uncharacterized protein N7496_008033 [Penicillium cataractarum]KAJ5368273.1 hypothetical protein N7496_008033 [Penicillium cataractarum]